MLLSDVWTQCTSNPNVIKIVGEIILDNKGFSKFADVLSNRVFNSSIDGEVQLRKFLTEFNYPASIDSIIKEIRDYLLKYGTTNMYKDYMHINRMKNVLRSEVKVSSFNYDFERVLDKFHKFFLASPANKFEEEMNSFPLAKFMTNTFSKHFLKSFSADVTEIVNEKGMIVGSGTGEEVSLVDLMEVRKASNCLDFKFQRDLASIQDASKLLFYSSRDKEFFSDFYSAYREATIKDSLSTNISKNIARAFCPSGVSYKIKSFLESSGYFPSIKITTGIYCGSDYQSSSYDHRISFIRTLIKYEDKNLNYEDLDAIHTDFYAADSVTVGNRNKKTLYNYDLSEDAKQNKDITYRIVKGFLALMRLKVYCLVKSIDFYSLPYVIFRDSKYYKVYKTLEDCLDYYELSKSLSDTPVPFEPQIPDNEKSYDMFLAGLKYNFNCIKPTIVEALEQKEKEVDTDAQIYKYIEALYGDASNNSQLMEALLEKVPDIDQLNTWFETEPSYRELLHKIYGDNDLLYLSDNIAIGLARYSDLYCCLLERILINLNCSITDSNYDIVMELGSGTLRPLPLTISDVNDLSDISSNLKVRASDKGITQIIIKQYRYFYAKIQQNLASVIPYVNTAVQNKIDELSETGFELQFTVCINSKMKETSLTIYNSDDERKYKNRSLQALLGLKDYKVKHGYVFYKNEPFMYRGHYVHDTGALVTDAGGVVGYLEPEIILGGSDN